MCMSSLIYGLFGHTLFNFYIFYIFIIYVCLHTVFTLICISFIYIYIYIYIFIVVQVQLSLFSPTMSPCPTHPLLQPLNLPPLALSMCSLHMFLGGPSPIFSHYPSLPSPLVTVSLFFISMALVIFCLLVCFVDQVPLIVCKCSIVFLATHLLMGTQVIFPYLFKFVFSYLNTYLFYFLYIRIYHFYILYMSLDIFSYF